MRSAPTILLCIILLAIGVEQAFAQPKMPFLDWGAGPCEYCLYGDWTTKKDTPIFHRMNSRSGVAFIATKNEKLRAITGVVITTQAGFGRALKPTILRKYDKTNDTYSDVTIARGETFHILTYHGEGVYTVWFKGQLLEASMDSREMQTISRPRFVWWVKLRNTDGQIGWTRMARNFNGPHEV